MNISKRLRYIQNKMRTLNIHLARNAKTKQSKIEGGQYLKSKG